MQSKQNLLLILSTNFQQNNHFHVSVQTVAGAFSLYGHNPIHVTCITNECHANVQMHFIDHLLMYSTLYGKFLRLLRLTSCACNAKNGFEKASWNVNWCGKVNHYFYSSLTLTLTESGSWTTVLVCVVSQESIWWSISWPQCWPPSPPRPSQLPQHDRRILKMGGSS